MDFELSDEHKRIHLPVLTTGKWLRATASAGPGGGKLSLYFIIYGENGS